MEPALVCQICGRSETDPADRVGWVMDRRGERISWTCARCAADNIRAMEAKLDPEWW